MIRRLRQHLWRRRFAELRPCVSRRWRRLIWLAKRCHRWATLWRFTDRIRHLWRLNKSVHSTLKTICALRTCTTDYVTRMFLFYTIRHIPCESVRFRRQHLPRLAKKRRSRGSLSGHSRRNHLSVMSAASGHLLMTARMSVAIFLLSLRFLHLLPASKINKDYYSQSLSSYKLQFNTNEEQYITSELRRRKGDFRKKCATRNSSESKMADLLLN